jgi:hypothetical protein
MEEAILSAEVVVIANGTPAFRRVPGLLRPDQILIDLVALTTRESMSRPDIREAAGVPPQPALVPAS